MTTLYIAGPMRGYPEFNFPEFDRAERILNEAGFETVNPATHDRAGGFDPKGMTGHEDLTAIGFNLRDALAWDLEQVASVDGVALLPGWEDSKGARAEVALAHALGTPVALAAHWTYAHPARVYITPGAAPSSGEVRTTSSTGGEKGTKPERYDLIPIEGLSHVARLYGQGAAKYSAHNWRKGYEWSKSYAAMQRHATQFWAGEDNDPEMGTPHLASVVFHALALMVFMTEQPGYDDRYKAPDVVGETGGASEDAGPAETGSEPAEKVLRVGARVRIQQGGHHSTFIAKRIGMEGDALRTSPFETKWYIQLDGDTAPLLFFPSELEVIG